MQIVFQDPYSSLNPRMRARQIVEEPLDHPRLGDRRRAARARRGAVRAGRPRSGASRALPARVQRRPAAADRPGARARAQPVVRRARRAGVGARRVGAGAGREPADGSAGALKLTYLFIAHDLRLVEHICSRVAVMYLGGSWRWGRRAGAVRRAAAPVHAGAAVGRSPCRIPPRAGRVRAGPRVESRWSAPLREIGCRTLGGSLNRAAELETGAGCKEPSIFPRALLSPPYRPPGLPPPPAARTSAKEVLATPSPLLVA